MTPIVGVRSAGALALAGYQGPGASIFGADKVCIVINGHRPSDQIALHLVTAPIEQHRMLHGGFDAFGQYRNVEAVAEIDHGAHDRHGMLIVLEIENESPIDLDFVECERMQVRQGRISGSEVIERDADAKGLEPGENGYRA